MEKIKPCELKDVELVNAATKEKKYGKKTV